MYQSFTGNPRRQREVNLSGRPTNPFASSSSSASGPQSAIASAQQERLQRQQQRDRVQASSRIQRVWRGHSARRKTFRAWRQIWDEIEEQHKPSHGAYSSVNESLHQLDRLMLFYSPKEDVRRLAWYGMRQMATNDIAPCADGPWPEAYLRISKACIVALQKRKKPDDELDRITLVVLAFAFRRSKMDKQGAVNYYETLTSVRGAPIEPLQNALLAPLKAGQEAYAGLAVLLAKPLEDDMLALLRSVVDTRALAATLSGIAESGPQSARSKLWLLGNLLYVTGQTSNATLTTVVARLLGSLADDVDFESPPIELENVQFDKDVLAKVVTGLPLNSFLHEQTRRLIDQQSIRNLLVRDTPVSKTIDAQLLAGYALTLLRCFPRRADDIRMWLYLGPTRSTTDVPATRYFWDAAKISPVFTAIWQNSRNALPILKRTDSTIRQKDDWTVILVFLELYTFLMKIMDDEEFIGGDSHGRRNSAVPVNDVAELVTFLKNLGFTLYFNSADINDPVDAAGRNAGSSALGRHFGNGSIPSPAKAVEAKPFTVAGLPGLTIDYLKGLVTGLLRAIYERDSRRHFLPKGHWLMTSRFDMTSFIPGVVMEEESRHQVEEQDAEDKQLDSEEEADYDPTYVRARGPASVLRNQQARERAQRKASRRRYLESVAPRLEILQNMPFFIPFTTRVEIFRQFVQLDQEKRRNGHTDPDLWRQSMMFQPNPTGMPRDLLSRHHAKIRRKNEFEDAFDAFYNLGPDLKEPIQITFVDEFDIPEAGIDGGGVTKEFLTSVITQAFDPENPEVPSFFVENDKHLLYPNPTAIEDLRAKYRDMGFKDNQPAVRAEVKHLSQQYEFLGRIIGKCLYEGILVDVSFAGFFLKKWALTGGANSAPMESGYRANINDLKELDDGLYRGLLALKNSTDDIESFGLTFTVDDAVGSEGDKHIVERELVKNGAQMTVIKENRLWYITEMARYRLQGQSFPQTQAFLKGLSSMVQPSWLSMFNQSELQTLIGGAAADIDVQDLRRNTLYGGTYVIGDDGREHPSVQLFWKVMAELPDEERRKLLKFVTSTPRGPLLGFSNLNPRFSIRDSGSDENRYPTTSTCVNLLKLPMYKSERMLREKLLAAVNSGAGFDLS